MQATATKKQDFLKGAAILAAASIFVKIIGAIYKIPIFNILDNEGIGYFQVSYNIYTLILTISTAGIPVALSRLVSSANACGKTTLIKRYFSVAFPAFTLIGLIGTLAMFVFADSFAGLMGNASAAFGIRVLSPAVLFACIISVYRGYAQGFENMIPTAASQVIEVICKALFGISAALLLSSLNYGSYVVSGGAIMGVPVGLALCIPVLVWHKRKLARARLSNAEQHDDESAVGGLSVLGRLMKVSVPITLSASFMSIMTVIDTAIIHGRLQNALGLSEELASAQFGLYSKGLTIYNLPPAIIVPLSVSIIPAIAAALAKKRHSEAKGIMQSSIKLVNLLAMPAAAGLIALAAPILTALYDDSDPTTIAVLMILGAASFFVCLQYVTTAILQANGHERVALLTFPVGAAVKLTLGYILVGNPDIGIIGSPIGTLSCFVVIPMLNIIFIMIKVKERPKFSGVIIKPLLCSTLMGGSAFLFYKIIHFIGSGIVGEGRMAVTLFMAAAILLAVTVYGVLIVATRTVTMEDMKLVPKGEKIAKILRISK